MTYYTDWLTKSKSEGTSNHKHKLQNWAHQHTSVCSFFRISLLAIATWEGFPVARMFKLLSFAKLISIDAPVFECTSRHIVWRMFPKSPKGFAVVTSSSGIRKTLCPKEKCIQCWQNSPFEEDIPLRKVRFWRDNETSHLIVCHHQILSNQLPTSYPKGLYVKKSKFW